jgi:hypothetical protein
MHFLTSLGGRVKSLRLYESDASKAFNKTMPLDEVLPSYIIGDVYMAPDGSAKVQGSHLPESDLRLGSDRATSVDWDVLILTAIGETCVSCRPPQLAGRIIGLPDWLHDYAFLPPRADLDPFSTLLMSARRSSPGLQISAGLR